jgi:hypothetical protein
MLYNHHNLNIIYRGERISYANNRNEIALMIVPTNNVCNNTYHRGVHVGMISKRRPKIDACAYNIQSQNTWLKCEIDEGVVPKDQESNPS